MKRIWLFAILTGCGLAALAGGHFGPKLWKEKRNASHSYPPPWRTQYLKLRITASKTRLLVMEPLFVQVQLENTSLMDIRLVSAGVGVEILKEGEARWVDCPDAQTMWKWIFPRTCGYLDYSPAGPSIVPAGQSLGIIHEIYRLWDSGNKRFQFALREPGRYHIRADLRSFSGPRPSKSFDEITIEVEEPKDRDRAALEYLKSGRPNDFAISQLILGSGSLDLVRFVRMFEGSVYAQYAAYSYASGFCNGKPADSLPYWKLLTYETERPFPLRAQAAAALVRAYRELGDVEAERALRDWLQEHMPEEYFNGRSYSPGWRWLDRGSPLFAFN